MQISELMFFLSQTCPTDGHLELCMHIDIELYIHIDRDIELYIHIDIDRDIELYTHKEYA